MQNVTQFDTSKHHIHAQLQIKSKSGQVVFFSAVIDTGASVTELSDSSLKRAGYTVDSSSVHIKHDQETQKYSKIRLSEASVLGQKLTDWVVYISKFDEGWGVDALIGLDFFKQFKVTIDYKQGIITTEPY